MRLLDGHKGLILGVANDRSLAYHIARNLVAHGAECAFSYYPGEKIERRVRKSLEEGGIREPWLHPCDAGSDEQLDALFETAGKHFGKISFVVHSLAFADKEYLKPGRFTETPRGVFTW